MSDIERHGIARSDILECFPATASPDRIFAAAKGYAKELERAATWEAPGTDIERKRKKGGRAKVRDFFGGLANQCNKVREQLEQPLCSAESVAGRYLGERMVDEIADALEALAALETRLTEIAAKIPGGGGPYGLYQAINGPPEWRLAYWLALEWGDQNLQEFIDAANLVAEYETGRSDTFGDRSNVARSAFGAARVQLTTPELAEG